MKFITKSMIGATALALSIGAASAANAAHVIDPPTAADPTGTYGNDDPAPRFTDVFTFSLPRSGFLTLTLFSQFMTINQNVNFLTNGVTINGVKFNVINRGNPEVQELTLAVTPGVQTLSISGSSQPAGAYNGTISFAAGAIPEPATWMLLILGFGAIGFGMRRKANVRTSVSYA